MARLCGVRRWLSLSTLWLNALNGHSAFCAGYEWTVAAPQSCRRWRHVVFVRSLERTLGAPCASIVVGNGMRSTAAWFCRVEWNIWDNLDKQKTKLHPTVVQTFFQVFRSESGVWWRRSWLIQKIKQSLLLNLINNADLDQTFTTSVLSVTFSNLSYIPKLPRISTQVRFTYNTLTMLSYFSLSTKC